MDLSEKPLDEIVNNHLGMNSCVRLSGTQIDYLSFYQKLGKSAVATSFVLSVSLSNMSFAQRSETSLTQKDSCLVIGKVDFNGQRFYESNNKIVFVIDSITYETRTNEKGRFEIILPKGAKVEYTNIQGMSNESISKRRRMNLRKVKIPAQRRRMGWL